MARRDSSQWHWRDDATSHYMFDLGGVVVCSDTLGWTARRGWTGYFSRADCLKYRETGKLELWPELEMFARAHGLMMERVRVFATDAGVRAMQAEKYVEEIILGESEQ